MNPKILLLPAIGAAVFFGYRKMTQSEAEKIIASDPDFAARVDEQNQTRAGDGKPPLTDAQIVRKRANEIAAQLLERYPALKAEIDRRQALRKSRGLKPLHGPAIMKIAQDMATEGKLNA